MIREFLDSDVDRIQFTGACRPKARVTLYSRNLDSDSAIVNGTNRGSAMDITGCVESADLTLSADSEASSCTLEVNLEGNISVDMFYNAAVTIHEGDESISDDSWPQTFWGYHAGAPQASEPNIQGNPLNADASYTRRGTKRTLSVTFVGRARNFSNVTITSPGVWLPKGSVKNPDPLYSARDNYDDIGSIAREFATSDWGMGLTGGEVNIGPLGYRIEKQLQIVQDTAWDALRTLLQPLHLVPFFNGRGVLSFYEELTTKEPIRTYSLDSIVGVPQPARSQRITNVVRMTGLDSETTRVLHADQRLLEVRGTFGFFDSEVVTKGTWGGDETESFRVINGTVTDPNGLVAASPRFMNIEHSGFIIEPISDPEFLEVDEFKYAIVIRNDVFQVVGAIALLIGGYLGAVLGTTLFGEISGQSGTPDTPNPGAIIAEIAAAGILVAGITILQQIGNFRFEVHGVPFEEAYSELPAEAVLGMFASFDSSGAGALRSYERQPEEFENHILSHFDDVTTDDGTVNKGVRTWAKERLGFEVAKSAPRTVRMVRDVLIEPGDVIAVGDQAIFVQTINRRLRRGANDPQTVSGFQIRTIS